MYEVILDQLDNRFVAKIMSTSYISPIDSLSDLEKDLKELGVKGDVLFDLLMSNGYNSNRFMQMRFNGNKFDMYSADAVSNITEDTIQSSAKFYRNNPKYIENSILSNIQKYILRYNRPLLKFE